MSTQEQIGSSSRVLDELRLVLATVQYFTRIPVPGWVGHSPGHLQGTARYFSLAGVLVGAIGALVFWASSLLFPSPLPAILSTAVTIFITGAFHEDGLADTFDGLGGGATRERALEIMKDSRIGAFGAIALVLALGLKIALLAVLAGQGAMAVASALLGAHVLSRLAPLFLIRWLPYVGDQGASKAKPLADAIGGWALLVGVAYALPAAALLLLTHPPLQAAASLVACLLGALYIGALLRRRLQGFTGDGLGATQQVCELAIYLALAWQA
jgi:adenosylcobinamide-GDP ribazoletransferase